eukprot:m.69346 g.69346  ORF g.69346 m.69346 type:complete len:588 (-) comp14119_c0_seq1:577-2340(-)
MSDTLQGIQFQDDLPDAELEAVFNGDNEFCSPTSKVNPAVPGDIEGSKDTSIQPLSTGNPSSKDGSPNSTVTAKRAATRKGGKTTKAKKAKDAPATDRVIFHVDVDSFYITAERTRNPSLLHQPVAVMQHNQGGFVALSYEAKRTGLKKGDAVGDQGRKRIHGLHGRKSLADCRLVCPDLTVLSMDTTYYRMISSQLQDCIQECLGSTAIVAKSSIDDFYIDVTATLASLDRSVLETEIDRLEACRCVHARDSHKHKTLRWASRPIKQVPEHWQLAYALAGRLRQQVATRFGTHFTLSVGIANCKLVARLVSSLNKPDGQTCCLPNDNAVVAQSTPLKLVPSLRHAQGDTLVDLIASATVRNSTSTRSSARHKSKARVVSTPKEVEPTMLGDVLTVPKAKLVQVIGGERAELLYQWAVGEDPSPVVARQIPASVIAERSFPPSDWTAAEPYIRQLSLDWLTRVSEMYTLHQRVATRFVIRWRQGYNQDGRVGGMQSTSLPLPPSLRQVLSRRAITQEQIIGCQEATFAHVLEHLQSTLTAQQVEVLGNTQRTGITANNYPGLTRVQLGAEGFEHRAPGGLASYLVSK